MKIRIATAADAVVLASLHHDSRRRSMPWLREVHDIVETTAYMADMVLRTCEVRVADQDGRPLGFVAVDTRAGELEHLYLAPDARRRGIGTHLLNEAKALSPPGLALWVFQRNAAARAFYEARAFVLEHMTDGATNEEKEPDARYRWHAR